MTCINKAVRHPLRCHSCINLAGAFWKHGTDWSGDLDPSSRRGNDHRAPLIEETGEGGKIKNDRSFSYQLVVRTKSSLMGNAPSTDLVKRSVLCGTLRKEPGLVLRFQLSLYSRAPSFDILFPFCRRSFLPVDMAPLHQYSELPGEEKLEGERHQSLPKSRKWSPLSLLLLIPLLFVASLVFVVGIAKFISQPIPPSQIGSSRWLAHEARQTNAQYLLGVGKADITGYVRGRRARVYC